MANVLLIWELVPEDTEMYLIPLEEGMKYERYLKEAHRKFINADDMSDGLRFLNTALSDSNPESGFEEHLGIFRSYKQNFRSPLTADIAKVYLSGFIL